MLMLIKVIIIQTRLSIFQVLIQPSHAQTACTSTEFLIALIILMALTPSFDSNGKQWFRSAVLILFLLMLCWGFSSLSWPNQTGIFQNYSYFSGKCVIPSIRCSSASKSRSKKMVLPFWNDWNVNLEAGHTLFPLSQCVKRRNDYSMFNIHTQVLWQTVTDRYKSEPIRCLEVALILHSDIFNILFYTLNSSVKQLQHTLYWSKWKREMLQLPILWHILNSHQMDQLQPNHLCSAACTEGIGWLESCLLEITFLYN